MTRDYTKLKARAESFASGCSRTRLELRLVDALTRVERERDELQRQIDEIP